MSHSNRRSTVWALLLLAIAVLAAFWPVLDNDFVSYDDEKYVTRNRHVQMGLSLESVSWAWTTFAAANWHPLTWTSHMLDWQLYGDRPAGHHLSSLLWHLANTLLLFLVLRGLTGSIGRSAFVAALFGVHPLHVESVAWVAERKDVLSTWFWFATIGAYVRYTRRACTRRLLPVLGLLVLGLLSKPMLVSVPFTLLLLDVWPLRRLETGRIGASLAGPVREKLPLFFVAAASAVVTLAAQRSGEAIGSMEIYPLADRLSNALVAYSAYLWRTVWPFGLAVHYPHPRGDLPGWQIAVAASLLLLITLGVFRARVRRPYLLMGWLWYVGTLVPVIGLIQVGKQAMADRYSYVPLIGIFIMVAFGVPDLFPPASGARAKRVVLATLACVSIALLIVSTRFQVVHWRDSVTLFEHALTVTPPNAIAHNGAGLALAEQGRLPEAIEHYRKAIEIRPGYAEAFNNLGGALATQGRVAEAIAGYDQALNIDPDYAEASNNLGVALARQGRFDEAIERFRAALAIRPCYGRAHSNLAAALHGSGEDEQAWREIEQSRRCGFEPPERLIRSLTGPTGDTAD